MDDKQYVKYEEFKEVKKDVKDIKDNHLPSILKSIDALKDKVKDLKWFFLGGMAVLGIVLGILQVFG